MRRKGSLNEVQRRSDRLHVQLGCVPVLPSGYLKYKLFVINHARNLGRASYFVPFLFIQAYYDKDQKRWVFPNESDASAPPPLGPPPTGGPMVRTMVQ